MSMLYAVLLAVVFAGHVNGYPGGAPSSACISMTPGHRSQGSALSPQSIASPYSLSVSASSYSTGTSLTVSVNGAVFQGVLLQARQPGQTTLIGTFTNAPANTKLNQCSSADDSVTHSSTTDKSDGTSFTWNPPAQGVGDIEFVVTVAQNHDTYWIGIKSDVITEAGVTEAATTQQTNTGATMDATTTQQTNTGATMDATTTQQTNTGASMDATTGNETITGTAPTLPSGMDPPVSDGITTGHTSCLIIIFNIVMVALFM